jgi:hypothetical protein
VHVPSVPASAHDRQVAVHAVAQHTPCAQTPLAQSLAALHVAPFGRLTHTPFEQTLGGKQSPSTAHATRQALPLQVYGSQDDEVAVRHVPMPLHVRAGVNVDALQAAATHTVPAACSRHAPAPLQKPSCAHVLAAAAAHWFSGSSPLGTLVQAPVVPGSAHDWQTPVHAVAQQTPCAQTPIAH